MNTTCAISHLCARSPPPNFSIRSNKFEKVERDNLLLFVITIWQYSHVKLTRNPQDYYPCYFSIFSLAKQIRETNSFQPSSPIRSGIFQDIVSPFNLPGYYFLENQPDLKERNSIVYQYVLSRLSSRAHWKPSYTQLKYEDSWTNSFIFLPRLLSIEPGIIADRNHRERERDRYSCIFEFAACFESLNDRARFHTRPRLKMRAKYPSTCDSLNARTPENVTLQRVLLSWLRGRLVRSSLARLIPPRQPRTHVRRRRGNERTVILAALWKNYFPLERHWGGGRGEEYSG